MPNRPAPALVAALALVALTGCSTRPPSGDASGGTVEWFAATKSQVAASADSHCGRYGKKGRITNLESDRTGGQAVFVCE